MFEIFHANFFSNSRLEKNEIKTVMKFWFFIFIKILKHSDIKNTIIQFQKCNVAHFVCHELSDLLDSSKNDLILQTTKNAIAESRQNILSVRKISQIHFSQAEIAHFSACSIAQNQAIKLSNEMLHVVSEFQIAGFRHVIDCLWSSDDKVCVEVTKLFYFELDQDKAVGFNIDKTIALALHKAVVKIWKNKEYRKRSLLWTQYVHFRAWMVKRLKTLLIKLRSNQSNDYVWSDDHKVMFRMMIDCYSLYRMKAISWNFESFSLRDQFSQVFFSALIIYLVLAEIDEREFWWNGDKNETSSVLLLKPKNKDIQNDNFQLKKNESIIEFLSSHFPFRV